MPARTVAKAITVSGGTSPTTVFVFPSGSGYLIRLVALDAPNGATYTWLLRDAGGYALAGASAISGDQTYYYAVPAVGPLSLLINSATDGAYAVEIGADFN